MKEVDDAVRNDTTDDSLSKHPTTPGREKRTLIFGLDAFGLGVEDRAPEELKDDA